MEKIEIKTEKIKKLLDGLSYNLDRLSFETFDSTFPLIARNMRDLHKEKSEVACEFGQEVFSNYGSDLLYRAKQIEEKFDTIVRIFSNEEKRLEKELSGVISRKKITNYLRY